MKKNLLYLVLFIMGIVNAYFIHYFHGLSISYFSNLFEVSKILRWATGISLEYNITPYFHTLIHLLMITLHTIITSIPILILSSFLINRYIKINVNSSSRYSSLGLVTFFVIYVAPSVSSIISIMFLLSYLIIPILNNFLILKLQQDKLSNKTLERNS